MEEESDKEVKLAKQAPLVDQYGTDKYYSARLLLREFQEDCQRFEKVGLKLLPLDIVDVLFRCKLLRATDSEKEYRQRGGFSQLDIGPVSPTWADKAKPLDVIENQYVSALEGDIRDRTLLSHISCLNSGPVEAKPQQGFFDDLFTSLGLSFACFLEGDHLIEKQKQLQPGLITYDLATAMEFFCASSIGYATTGTRNYCFWRGAAWLRTLLNLLRIAAFIHPGQREFTIGPKMEPPTFPVFLGMHSHGSYQWNEDAKESWQKFPDGCLIRSHGFRGLSNMWLDLRNFSKIKKFMLDHKIVFEHLRNPWSPTNTGDVAPTLDILSSATQMPDLGAKILLIYCCLEHLFVPEEAGAENKKYIIGGLKALNPKLSSWFDQLYKKRNEYAHKGFVLRTHGTWKLISDSMTNVMSLLVAKLSVNNTP